MANKDSQKKVNNKPIPGKVSELTEKEVEELITKPVAQAKPIFDYLAEWRSQSLKSSFSFA